MKSVYGYSCPTPTLGNLDTVYNGALSYKGPFYRYVVTVVKQVNGVDKPHVDPMAYAFANCSFGEKNCKSSVLAGFKGLSSYLVVEDGIYVAVKERGLWFYHEDGRFIAMRQPNIRDIFMENGEIKALIFKNMKLRGKDIVHDGGGLTDSRVVDEYEIVQDVLNIDHNYVLSKLPDEYPDEMDDEEIGSNPFPSPVKYMVVEDWFRLIGDYVPTTSNEPELFTRILEEQKDVTKKLRKSEGVNDTLFESLMNRIVAEYFVKKHHDLVDEPGHEVNQPLVDEMAIAYADGFLIGMRAKYQDGTDNMKKYGNEAAVIDFVAAQKILLSETKDKGMILATDIMVLIAAYLRCVNLNSILKVDQLSSTDKIRLQMIGIAFLDGIKDVLGENWSGLTR